MVLSTTAGLQVPVIPLVDVVDRTGAVPPSHILSDVPKLKVGVIFGFTVTVKVTGSAQIPAAGVKVYVPEAVLFTTEGFQVPLIPFVDVVGNAGTVPPLQMVSEVPNAKLGMRFGFTVTDKLVGTAHCPGFGVNV